MEFKVTVLSEMAKITMGQSPKSEFYNNVSGFPFLQGNRTFGHLYPIIDTFTEKITKKANSGDILMSVRAPVGDLNIAPDELCIGRGLASISVDEPLRNFVYYLLKNEIRNLENQSTGTIFSSINKKTLEQLKVTVPSKISDQKTIGDFLWSLDEKIDINNKTIINLEELAQTLFKRWFIDFEFPDEEGNPYKSNGGDFKNSDIGFMPQKWKIGTVGDIAVEKKQKINLSNSDESYNYIGLEHMPRGSISLDRYENSEKVSGSKSLFSTGDILFGKLRPYFKKVGIAPVDGVCSTDIIVLNAKKMNLTAYLLQLITTDNFINYTSNTATGTRMPRTGIQQIFNYKIAIPDDRTLNKFDHILNNFYTQILLLGIENHDLAILRDTLLPKLMSGEIELPDDLEVEEHAELLQ